MSYSNRNEDHQRRELTSLDFVAAKTKPLQPPSRNGQSLHIAEQFDLQNTIPIADKFYNRMNEKGIAWSSSRKRISVVPGMPSPSHPTGLGARTISPTDTRRAKRMSNMQIPSTTPHTPPTPQSDSARNRKSSPLPSNIPAKVLTPYSPGISPDPNRKCYVSRLSPASTPGSHCHRESIGSLQSRALRPVSSSKLPTSKSRNLQISSENERQEEEYVPPVPAIPKAFESPKEMSADSTGFLKKKSNLPIESTQFCNVQTENCFHDCHFQLGSQDDLKGSLPQRVEPADFKSRPNDLDTNHGKKKLQPLRLPPMNLRPLSTTTANKVEAYKNVKSLEDQYSNTISLSSPMAASKASPFFGNKSDSSTLVGSPGHSRSSSALHSLRSGSNLTISATSKSTSTIRDTRSGFPPVSSTMLSKKAGAAYGCIPRTRNSDDITNDRLSDQKRLSTQNGPRGLNLNLKGSVRESPPAHSCNSDEPPTPLSASSLRRKLSLGWRRSTSKSSVNFYTTAEREPENPSVTKIDDNTSLRSQPTLTTLNSIGSDNLPSPSLSVKSTTYFDFKRRKSSVSSMSMFGGYHDRTISEGCWGIQNNPVSSSKLNPDHSVPAPRTSSMMYRKLTVKGSSGTSRPIDGWTVDLDKDDLTAEEEMKKIASKRKETESAARRLDSLNERASAKEPLSPQEAILEKNLNIFERGEIVDYKEIYFCGTREAKKHVGNFPDDEQNFGYDDDRGDYKIIPGDHIYYRYEIVDLLGRGSFGQVVRCIDHKTGGLVAVKIIRNKKRFHQQALVEVNILKKLREWDPNGSYNMIRFTQSFYFRRHLCISAELLDMNLYELIKLNSFRGFSLKIVRRFTKQILNSLLLLQQHKVIHCDLKPENVLLAHPLHTQIKVIDFGSSCFENEKVYTYIQSRFYRSPEVILGMTYGMPIDIWSLGCIMAELYSGLPIFPGENEQEQLACIMEVFGPPEKHLIEKSTRRKVFFDSLGKPRSALSPKGRRRRPSSKSLHQVLKCDDPAFLDFISKCLKWDPDRRIKPEDAIRHEFITGQKAQPPSSSSRHTSTYRNVSPIKRNSTVKSNFATRPLPEPPKTSSRKDKKNKSHDFSGSKGSPMKNSSIVTSYSQRRQSTVNGSISPQYSKRIVHGAINGIGTHRNDLPRVARNASSRVDAQNVSSNFFPRNSSLVGVGASNSVSTLGARRGV
ncbi:putative dual specificity protein kinase pom1 [Erysiphe neolycopersici]|uniref:dual-specificity kinase n=1 Tax=Erysiphe neolycopersici TaxID=212602 RepID=A0A420HXU9_9PEZI|nr:putative dual specificity protein kinase pom1 [Erysiphe neolycopersici]